jgi:hypothetical protein
MEDRASIFKHPGNFVVVVFSAVFAVVYGYWELHFPSAHPCGSNPIWGELSRIALVVGWLVYINAFRARRGRFAAKYAFVGAFSGGGAIMAAFIGLDAIEWVTSNSLGVPASGLLKAPLMMFPVVLISGLYSAFSPNSAVAVGQGISCFALQILLYFLVESPYLCVY